MKLQEAKAILASATLRPMTEYERDTYFIEEGEEALIGEAPGGWFILATVGLGAQLQDEEGNCWIYDEQEQTVSEG